MQQVVVRYLFERYPTCSIVKTHYENMESGHKLLYEIRSVGLCSHTIQTQMKIFKCVNQTLVFPLSVLPPHAHLEVGDGLVGDLVTAGDVQLLEVGAVLGQSHDTLVCERVDAGHCQETQVGTPVGHLTDSHVTHVAVSEADVLYLWTGVGQSEGNSVSDTLEPCQCHHLQTGAVGHQCLHHVRLDLTEPVTQIFTSYIPPHKKNKVLGI